MTALTLTAANTIVEAAFAKGAELKLRPLGVSVLDAGGHLVAFQRQNIRHLNALATSMRAGLVDLEEAASEIDLTEDRLHELIDRLRPVAGVER